jgi:hypothetical protein
VSVATETLSLASALLAAVQERTTGQLSTTLGDGRTAKVFLDEGRVYAVFVREGGPTLGERLVANGTVSAHDVELALAAQRSDVPGWRVGELLVNLGYASAQAVRSTLAEQMAQMLGSLLAQPQASWRLRPGSRTRTSFATSLDVLPLLGDTAAIPAARLAPEHADDSPTDVQPPQAEDLVEMDRVSAYTQLRELTTLDGDDPDWGEQDMTPGAGLRRSLANLPRPRADKERRGFLSRLLG